MSNRPIGCLALLILTSLLLAGGLRLYILNKITGKMTPQELEAMDRFFNEPVDFPAEWAEVPSFSQQFENERERMRQVLSDWADQPEVVFPRRDRNQGEETFLEVLQRRRDLTIGEWRIAEARVRTVSPFTEAWFRYSRLQEYEIQTVPIVKPTEPPGNRLPDLEQVQLATRFQCLNAHLQARDGEWPAALKSVLNALRKAKRRPASCLIVHILGIAVISIGSDSIAALAVECDDIRVLRTALVEMNRLGSLLNLDLLDDAPLVDHLGTLRLVRLQSGRSVDMAPGKEGVYYSRQLWRPGGPWHGLCPTWGPRLLRWFVTSDTALARFFGSEEYIYQVSTPDTLAARAWEQTAQSKFDLARLLIAGRVQELETGERTSQPEDLVPRRISAIPNDPFSGEPLRWDAKSEAFYSVGPDEMDDGNVLRYAPTNGTFSVGDISVP